MHYITLIIKILLSIPNTLYFNFKVLPFRDALKLPFLIGMGTKVDVNSKGRVRIEAPISTFMIKYNFYSGTDGVSEYSSNKGYLKIGSSGEIIFKGKSNFAHGISIRCDYGVLTIGDNVTTNKYCFISCNERVSISDDVLIGWHVNIRDSDGHEIYELKNNKSSISKDNSIYIGSHSWLAANVDILKGVHLQPNTIVGYNSCVTKSFSNQNILIAGYPAVLKKDNVGWNR